MDDELRVSAEIGGTKLQAGLGTSGGKILQIKRCSVPPNATAPDIRGLITELIRSLEPDRPPSRLGIGFGGLVDTGNGRVVRSFQITGWDDFPLREWAEGQFGLPCVVDNDTNCAALAEARLGAGAGAGVVFYTNIGSGVGGGLVVDGKLYSRPCGALEIGHTKIWDRRAGCYVEVEQLCSGWSIGRIARRMAAEGRFPGVMTLVNGNIDEITARHVGIAAARGDVDACSLISRAAGHFGMALCNIIALLNPEIIVVGGGVSLLGDLFFDPLRKAVSRHVFAPFANHYNIVPAGLGETVVIAGALLIADEFWRARSGDEQFLARIDVLLFG